MKTGKEWEAWYWDQDFETGEGVMARFAEAVQADALESAATLLDLHGALLPAPHGAASTIVRSLTPFAPASPEAAPQK